MRAEREKRAVILTSEVERHAKINQPEGEAAAIIAVATTTADGLHRVGSSLVGKGGPEAMRLRVAQQCIDEFGNLAKSGNTLVVPANLADLASMIALATNVARGGPG